MKNTDDRKCFRVYFQSIYARLLTTLLFFMNLASLELVSERGSQTFISMVPQEEPHVFREILQRYSKLVILGTLGMPGYVHLK